MNMYENSGYYDPPHDPNFEDSIRLDIEDAAAAAIGLEHHLGFVDDIIDMPKELVMDMPPPAGTANWEPASQVQYDHAAYGPGSDLLNMLQLPRCAIGSAFPVPPGAAASVSFNGTSIWNEDGSMLYDPYQVSQAPDVLRDLYRSLPQNYGLFCGVEEREGAIGGVFQEDGNVMEYRRGEGLMGKGEGKGNFVTERERRQQLNGKYTALRKLIPNPTKNDRASIVGDAIEYVKELLRTVDELKIVVQKKKDGRERRKMLKSEEDSSTSMRAQGDDHDRPHNGALRSSWLQRRSKDSFVDVRIVDDEVNIKLNQKRKPNCLLYIAKVLEELQLDLVHVSGGNIGDSYVFMLNTKICEGSSVYAGAIAKKLLEVMDRQYSALAFPANY